MTSVAWYLPWLECLRIGPVVGADPLLTSEEASFVRAISASDPRAPAPPPSRGWRRVAARWQVDIPEDDMHLESGVSISGMGALASASMLIWLPQMSDTERQRHFELMRLNAESCAAGMDNREAQVALRAGESTMTMKRTNFWRWWRAEIEADHACGDAPDRDDLDRRIAAATRFSVRALQRLEMSARW